MKNNETKKPAPPPSSPTQRGLPSDPRLASILGKLRAKHPKARRDGKAKRMLPKLAAIKESDAVDWLELVIWVMRGNISSKEALGLTKQDAVQFVRLGTHHLSHGNLEEAEAAGKLAVAAAPKMALAWHLLGDALAQKRKDTEALVALQQARDLDPKNVRVWVDIAEVHISRIEYAAAIAALKKARELDVDGKTPAGRRAQMLIMQTLMTLEDQ